MMAAVSAYYSDRDDMNNANAIPAHGGHFSPFWRAVVMCTCDHRAISGQESCPDDTHLVLLCPGMETDSFAWPGLQQFVVIVHEHTLGLGLRQNHHTKQR